MIYLSSFSKTLAPGFRVAWIDAPAPLATKLEMAKQAEDLLTGSLDQRIVYEACRRGILQRQLPLLRRHYQHKRDVMVDALHATFGDTTVVAGTARRVLPLGDAARPDRCGRCSTRAVDHGVIYVAGEAFFVDGSGRQNLMRLSFSAPPPERIREGVPAAGERDRARPSSRPISRGGCGAVGARTASPGKRRERLHLGIGAAPATASEQ